MLEAMIFHRNVLCCIPFTLHVHVGTCGTCFELGVEQLPQLSVVNLRVAARKLAEVVIRQLVIGGRLVLSKQWWCHVIKLLQRQTSMIYMYMYNVATYCSCWCSV